MGDFFSHVNRDFFSSNAFARFFTGTCNAELIDNVMCKNAVFEICGPSVSVNVSRIPVYLKHFPAGTSVKNMVHFGQLVEIDKYIFF